MRTRCPLQFLLLASCLVLHAQSPKIQLSINPDAALRDASPQTVVFSATVTPNHPQAAVTLCLVNTAGTVLSTHGNFRDDGVHPDQSANDGKYTPRLAIPVDKVGTFRFIARARFVPPLEPASSPKASFSVMFQTLRNTEGNLLALTTESTNYITYFIEQTGILSVKILRANTAKGPWTVVHSFTSEKDEGELRAQWADPDTAASSANRYYKVELYDRNSVLKRTFLPLFVPAYADEDRQLQLTGSPPTSRIIPASAKARINAGSPQ